MQQNARGDEGTAQGGEECLHAPPLVAAFVYCSAAVPLVGRHPGARHRLADGRRRRGAGAFEHKHAGVQHIEGEVRFAADERPYGALQPRNLFRAIQALDGEGSTHGG